MPIRTGSSALWISFRSQTTQAAGTPREWLSSVWEHIWETLRSSCLKPSINLRVSVPSRARGKRGSRRPCSRPVGGHSVSQGSKGPETSSAAHQGLGFRVWLGEGGAQIY